MELNFFLGIIAGTIIVLAAFAIPAIMRISRTAKATEEFLLSMEGSLKPLMIKLDETVARTNRVTMEVEESLNNVRNLTNAVGQTGAVINDVNNFMRKTQMLVSVNTLSLGAGIKTALAVFAQGLLKKEVKK